jgi:RND superfamily putative drug exporter
MRTETLEVRGMTCGGCERRIRAAVSALPGVADVVGPESVPARLRPLYQGAGGSAVEVVPRASPFSGTARDLVDRIRALPGHGTSFEVTGQTAGELDFLRQIEHRAPWALGAIFLASYLVLAFAFRSALLPAKAVVMNTLSIAASFGVLVWVF